MILEMRATRGIKPLRNMALLDGLVFRFEFRSGMIKGKSQEIVGLGDVWDYKGQVHGGSPVH